MIMVIYFVQGLMVLLLFQIKNQKIQEIIFVFVKRETPLVCLIKVLST